MTRTTTVDGAFRRTYRAHIRYGSAALASVALTAALAVSPHAAGASTPDASPPRIAPPGASTVYTLEPLNYNREVSTPGVMYGAMCRPPARCVQVPTEAALDPTHVKGDLTEDGPISRAAAALDEFLNSDSEQGGVVVGLSQGGQVAAFWLNNYAPTAAVRPDTRFVSLGSPANTYGVPWTPKIPTDSEFHITEIWYQYDGWTDWPAQWRPLAVANAIAGMFVLHTKYALFDPDDPSIVAWDIGTVSYRMLPTEVLPLLQPLNSLGMTSLARELSTFLRPFIEAAYERPATQDEADTLTAAAAADAAEDMTVGGTTAATTHPTSDTLSGSEAENGSEAQETVLRSGSSNAHREREADTAAGTDGEAEAETDTTTDGDTVTEADGDTVTEADGDTVTEADGDGDGDTEADGDGDGDTDGDGDGDGDTEADGDGGKDRDTDSDGDKDRDRDTVTEADSDKGKGKDRTTDRTSARDTDKGRDRAAARASASTGSASDSKPSRESRTAAG